MCPAQPLSVALFLVAVGTVVTGALHIDGIADVADAFGGGKTTERVLEILKDPRHGTFGVTTIVLVIAAKLILYSYFVQRQSFLVIGLSLILSRSIQALSLCFLPNARGQGSVAASFAAGNAVKVATVLSALLVPALALALRNAWWAAIPIVCALVASAAFLGVCMRKIRGITGDCVGAASETCEVAMLCVGLLVSSAAG
jgi:adenosylcobinamide-GDP ribazoletransferase